MSYTQLYYHIVFGSKSSEPVIVKKYKNDLYNYIWGIIKNQGGTLLRIGGAENHVHIFTSIPSTVAVSNFVQSIKGMSSKWLQNEPENRKKFPFFHGWAEGYCALTYSYRDREVISNYIKNQEEHHRRESWREEFIRLLKEFNIQYDERYLPPY